MIEKLKEIDYLILIVSPFQYLCVLEYLHEHNIPKLKCGLITVTDKKVAYEHIVNCGETDEFSFFEAPFVKQKRYQWQAISLTTKLKEFREKQLIVGNIQDVWCHAMVKFNQHENSPVVLDDGTNSIAKIEGKIKGEISVNRSWNPREFVARVLFQLNRFVDKELHFFTIFDEFINRDDNIEINTFAYAKRKYGISDKKLVNEVWFIGAPYTKYDIISTDDYNEIIQTVKKFAHHNNCTLKYFKHRLETSLPIKNKFVVENSEPFEVFYFKNSHRPKYVIGLYSTCLTVLGIMNIPTSIISLEIDPTIRNKANWQMIDEIYNYMVKNTSVEVKKVKQLVSQ